MSGQGNSNLNSELSILDEHGAVAKANALRFNEFDVASRKTVVVPLKPPTGVNLRLLNTGVPADFWIAVLAPDAPFIPMFGSVVPRPLPPAGDASGGLDADEDVYYATRFTPGNYRISADFSHPERGNLNGFVAVLDVDGGNEQELVRFNEFDISARQVATLTVKKDEPRILRIHNGSGTVSYTLKIAKIE